MRSVPTDLTKVPIAPEKVWQGGLALFPSWIEPHDHHYPFRPWLAAWCDAQDGFAYPPKLGESGDRDAGLLVEALRETVRKAGREAHLPARLQVAHPRDAAVVREGIAGTGIVVEVVDRVDAFTHLRDALREREQMENNVPALKANDEIPLESVRSFAQAAVEFYRAEPWEKFDEDDLMEIDCDLADPKLRLATIMGAGGEEFGIFFMESREQHESILSGEEEKGGIIRLGGDWGISFVFPYEIPVADHDLWLDNDLPLADPMTYPYPVRIGPRGQVGRPDARQLAYFEGLMRAITDATDDEIDSGAWEKTAPTSKGSVAVRIRLPGLADETPATASTPLEQAQELATMAFHAAGRSRIKLARRAIAVCPDCADAYGILAARSADPAKTQELMEQAVAAGERGLRSLGIEGDAIHWDDFRCRPYLRARLALGVSLAGIGRTQEAAGHFEELLRIDPRDPQGARYRLLPLCLEDDRDGDASALIDRFPGEGGAMWPYVRALLAFRREGETERANDLADRAIKANPFVWKFLAGTQELPHELPDDYRPGSRDEAILVADDIMDIWDETPGAPEWIRVRGRNRSKGSGPSSGAGGKGKRPAGKGKGKRR